MSSCNVQSLMTSAATAGFNRLERQDAWAVANQLLCNMGGGGSGGAVWGSNGQNVVRPIGNVYVRDSFTGLYYKQLATSEFTPGVPQLGLGDTGYAFSAIPD